jgi:guanine deaminase
MTESARPTVIRNALLADAARRTAEAGDLLIVDGRIAEVGPPGLAAPPDAAVLDATDRLIVPGLINGHTHSHLTIGKGLSQTWTLETHLHNGPWVAGSQTLDDRRLLARLAAVEMLMKGCTACYDLVLELPAPTPDGLYATAQGYLDAGMRVAVAPMMADRTFWQAIPGLMAALPEGLRGAVEKIVLADYETSLAACRVALRGWPHDRAHAVLALAPTIPLHCSDAFWTGCRDLAQEFDVGMHAHLAESKVQAVSGPTAYGESLTRHLDRLGIISERFTAAHGVWLTEDDIAVLGARGAKVSHNPSSNFRLGNGIANVPLMRRHGVTVALGTDTCSCSDHLNMFEVMRLACYLPRVRSFDSDDWLMAADVLQMATENGAAALGLGAKLGRIAPGYAADLVLLDLTTINYLPLNNAVQQMVFAEEGRGVDTVLVDGKAVVRAGKPLLVDYETLRREVTDRNAQLKAANAGRRDLLAALEPYVKRFCVGLAGQSFPVQSHLH